MSGLSLTGPHCSKSSEERIGAGTKEKRSFLNVAAKTAECQKKKSSLHLRKKKQQGEKILGNLAKRKL